MILRKENIDLESLELKYRILLPPIYKVFLKNFNPYLIGMEQFIDDKNSIRSLTNVIYTTSIMDSYTPLDDELSFNYFYDFKEVFEINQNWDGRNEDYLFVAGHSFRGGLMVGIKDYNLDKIYFDDLLQISFLADNIFDLINKFKISINYIEFNNLDKSKIFMKFGDKFWRNENTPTPQT